MGQEADFSGNGSPQVKQLPPLDAPVLVVDDDPVALSRVEVALQSFGVSDIILLEDSRTVSTILERRQISVAIVDVYMPVVSGWDLIPVIASLSPRSPIIVLSAVGDIESAVRSMREGAFDYIEKPFAVDRLSSAVFGAIDQWKRNGASGRPPADRGRDAHVESGGELFSAIVTRDPRLTALFDYVGAIAPTSFPVLVTGETGTGKELFSGAIHAASGRTGRLVAVNVAGLNDELFSDTLFGHRRGAFTGADSDRPGMIARAEGGTLFLDEIGDLSSESQIKLLRLIQENHFFPLGSDTPIESSARLVFATNHDLAAHAIAGRFRRDLFYRLQAHHIHIPPLRERIDDLPLLVETFVVRAAERVGKPVPKVPDELYDLLRAYDFPGNVRELEGMVSDALVRHRRGVLSLNRFREAVYRTLTDVRPSLGRDTDAAEGEPSADAAEASPGSVEELEPLLPVADRNGDNHAENLFRSVTQLPTLERAEADLIDEALRRSNGNQSVAARFLGISRQALNNRLRRQHSDS